VAAVREGESCTKRELHRSAKSLLNLEMSADQHMYFMEATQSQERTTQKDYREQSLILSQFVFPTAKEENMS